MLTENQQKYILTIPKDKIVIIKPFDQKIYGTAQDIIQQINKEFSNLKILFMGASALGIAGQNDIDLNIVSKPAGYHIYLPILKKLFGKPVNQNQVLIKWEFQRNGFDVELYLTNHNSPALQEQIKTFGILKNDPVLLKEYEQIKLSSNGLPFCEYMKRKYEFFNRITERERGKSIQASAKSNQFQV